MEQATLIEGIAGSGKSTYIARCVQDCVDKGMTLLLSFSHAGKEVLSAYTQAVQDHPNLQIHTIDQLALSVLWALGDDRPIVDRETVLQWVLPEVVNQASQTWTNKTVQVPSLNKHDLDLLLKDIDFFRVSLAYLAPTQEEQAVITEGQLNYDLTWVSHVFSYYEKARYTWRQPVQGQNRSCVGFRQLHEVTGDLLDFDKASIQACLPHIYRFIFIDEFHDVTPMQMGFIHTLLHDETQIVAVGDRFQNIFSWRGTNTDTVFEAYKKDLQADVSYLNQSYRFGETLARQVSALIHRPVLGAVKKDTKIKLTTLEQVCENHKKFNSKMVLVAQDYAQLVKAGFELYQHRQEAQRIGFALTHLPLVAFINVLYALQKNQWVGEPKFAKQDVARFLDGHYCLLSQAGKKEILTHVSPSSLRYDLSQQAERHFTAPMQSALRAWLDTSVPSMGWVQAVAWFLEEAQYFRTQQDGMFDKAQWHSWQVLQTLIRQEGDRLDDWPVLYYKLLSFVNSKTGLRMMTVSQVKGKEFDQVMVYGASPRGFEPWTAGDPLQRNLFYVAITRAKKELDICVPLQVVVDE